MGLAATRQESIYFPLKLHYIGIKVNVWPGNRLCFKETPDIWGVLVMCMWGKTAVFPHFASYYLLAKHSLHREIGEKSLRLL